MSGHQLRLSHIAAHQAARSQTDEWYTPPEILDRLPVFDLDPSAPITGPTPWARVRSWHSIETDGLAHEWAGHVWLNPPYSDVEPWVARLAEHGDGIALVFARCETGWWFRHIWSKASRLLFIRGRVSFVPGDPDAQQAKGHNSGGPSVLVGFGAWAADVLDGCGIPGALVTPAPVSSREGDGA